MGVNSYAEIFTTLIGWHMYNVCWNVLAETGIIFLPFLGILIEHWRTAFVDGEESGGAGAGLRALEVDLYVTLFVILIACMPNSLTSLNRSQVFYAPPATSAEPSPVVATGSAPGSTFGNTLGGTPAQVPVPVWWYGIMGVSAGVSSAIISGAGLSLDDLRKVTEASKHASIDSPHTRHEALRFYNECFLPARTKYLNSPASPAAESAITTYGPADPDWVGSHALRDDPDLYGAMYSEREVPGWSVDPVRDRDRVGSPIPPTWGRPSCKEWWEGGSDVGLRSKIITAVELTSDLNGLVANLGSSLTSERRADLVAQTVLDKTSLTVIPDPYVPSNSGFVKETSSSTAVMIAGFATTFFTWLATSVLKPSLPFIQALLLMGIYAMLPFVMVVSRYNLITLINVSLAIFTIRMWSVLWFLTDFLDDKLALAIYPDADSALSALSSFFRIGDPTKAMLLNLVVMSLYLALPALWSGLMAMAGMRVSSALSPAGTISDPVRAAGSSASNLGGRAASLGARGLVRGAKHLRSKTSSKDQ